MASSRFLLLGEPLALDLVNTRVRKNGLPIDLLDSGTALADWLAAERARIAWRGSPSAADLKAVRTLRDAIDQLLSASHARRKPSGTALARLNRALALRPGQATLAWGPHSPIRKSASSRTQRGTLLAALAADAVALLTGPDAARVRKCAHPDCILRFLARNRRRRWCSSATCGNRARVAKHYREQREAARCLSR